MTKILRRKTKLTQHGVTNEMSPRYTKEQKSEARKRRKLIRELARRQK